MKSRTGNVSKKNGQSLPARGVWIEICCGRAARRRVPSRSPQGECGLKYDGHASRASSPWSLPARGVWIEIPSTTTRRSSRPVAPRKGSVDWNDYDGTDPNKLTGRSPQGECGLKCCAACPSCRRDGRSPQGECGLKYAKRNNRAQLFGRSPQGECGLKYAAHAQPQSHVRRSPQGECGLKFEDRVQPAHEFRRSPQGECGLKLAAFACAVLSCPVVPRKGSVD